MEGVSMKIVVFVSVVCALLVWHVFVNTSGSSVRAQPPMGVITITWVPNLAAGPDRAPDSLLPSRWMQIIKSARLGDPETDAFFTALRRVECWDGMTIGDNGKARGYFQLHPEYVKDVDLPNGWTYESVCDDVVLSRLTVTAYFQKWAPEAWEARDWARLATVHHQGPRGRLGEVDTVYFSKFGL